MDIAHVDPGRFRRDRSAAGVRNPAREGRDAFDQDAAEVRRTDRAAVGDAAGEGRDRLHVNGAVCRARERARQCAAVDDVAGEGRNAIDRDRDAIRAADRAGVRNVAAECGNDADGHGSAEGCNRAGVGNTAGHGRDVVDPNSIRVRARERTTVGDAACEARTVKHID